jgi:hypothetical protein
VNFRKELSRGPGYGWIVWYRQFVSDAERRLHEQRATAAVAFAWGLAPGLVDRALEAETE